MKKLIMMISVMLIGVPCFAQDAPVYPCSPAEEVVQPCESVAVECEPCAPVAEEQEISCDTIVTKQRVIKQRKTVAERRVAFRNAINKFKAKRASYKKQRKTVVQSCAPVAEPCAPACDY